MPNITLTCFICNLPMRRMAASGPQGEAAHNKCRTSVGGIRAHGRSGYRGGCRCDLCRAAQSEVMKTYMANYRTEHGVAQSTVSRRRFREANGYWPNARGGDWIHPKLRLEIYKRDDWTCYLCAERMDASTPVNNPNALTLDHVTPRSKGGSDEPENLKTCCRDCNVRKSDKILTS